MYANGESQGANPPIHNIISGVGGSVRDGGQLGGWFSQGDFFHSAGVELDHICKCTFPFQTHKEKGSIY